MFHVGPACSKTVEYICLKLGVDDVKAWEMTFDKQFQLFTGGRGLDGAANIDVSP
mgnify:CR=1 FL=1